MKESKGTNTGKAEGTKAKNSTAKKSEKEVSAIDKIRKLMEFSLENGATESEVENAMKLAQRLMLKYSLEKGDLEVTSNDVNITTIPDTWKKGTESKLFQHDLLRAIALGFSCRVLRSSDKGSPVYKLVGLTDDRNIVEETFYRVLPQVRVMTKARYKESDKSLSAVKFTISYQSGFIMGLVDKMLADRQEFLRLDFKKDKDEKVADFGQRKKDVENMSLIITKKDSLVADFIKSTMSVKSSSPKQANFDKGAFSKGKEDGSQKTLKNQLGQ